jgi:hypothetical protein
VGRFFLEFLRLDTSLVGGLDVNQTLMGAVAVLAALALFLRHRIKSSAAISSEVQTPEVNSTSQEPQLPQE